MLKEYKSVYKRNKKSLRENVDIVTPIKWSNMYYMSYDEAEDFAKKKNWLVPLWDELYKSFKNKKIYDWKPGKYLSATPIKDAITRGVHLALNIITSIKSGKKTIEKDIVGGIERTNVRFITSYIDKEGNLIRNKGDSFLDRIF